MKVGVRRLVQHGATALLLTVLLEKLVPRIVNPAREPKRLREARQGKLRSPELESALVSRTRAGTASKTSAPPSSWLRIRSRRRVAYRLQSCLEIQFPCNEMLEDYGGSDELSIT